MKENSLCLKVIYPIEMRREVVLPKEGLIIGRSVEADFILEDEWISRKHCKVIQDKK
jgi:pSer/pThr/pTyr-binding forkhead associated (FHA) protein